MTCFRRSKELRLCGWNYSAESSLIGKSLTEANIRSQTGASVVALIRDKQLIANPKSITIFEAGDRIGVIGEYDQLEKAQQLVRQ